MPVTSRPTVSTEFRALERDPHEHVSYPPDELRREELAGFLRGRRERIVPTQVGLPPGGRRRTPGLRREEVAQLAGVGVTWYTWLEQGRDISVSESVLNAIARALLLDPHERSHLYLLSGVQPPPIESECTAVTPEIRTILKKLEPFPACVQSARYDMLAFNYAYSQFIEDLNSIPMEDRNSLWLAFTSPCWRRAIVDWEDTVSRMVAQYRLSMAKHLDDPTWKCLIKRLCKVSPEFNALWDRHEIKTLENRTKRFLHSRLGLMNLNYTHLWMGPQHDTRLIAYTPADDESSRLLEKL